MHSVSRLYLAYITPITSSLSDLNVGVRARAQPLALSNVVLIVYVLHSKSQNLKDFQHLTCYPNFELP